MGIYLPNMEMPKPGRYFVAVDNAGRKGKTVISVMSEFERGDKTRPLLAVHEAVPVPPHGRLGDLDALKERITKRLYSSNHGSMAEAYYAALIDLIDTAPTIIPAEEGET